MIIDGHAHVSATDFGNADQLLRQLDQAGIDKAVCIAGGTIDLRQFSRVVLGRLQPNPNVPNHLVYEAIKRHADRFYGFVYLNPKEKTLETLKEGLDRGCRGVKLAPQVHRFVFKERVLAEVADECGRRGFPVYTHVLPSPGASTADFAELARRHPKTNFILGHMGFGPGDADAIDFAAKIENLYLESSLGNYLILQDAIAKLGPRKLVFGSEFPLSHPKVELEKIRLLDLKEADFDLVCRGNITRLIGVG
jgi:predicted TIM-barrel fold metal-dependent hydrolase